MSPQDENGYLHTLVGGLGAALVALGTWAWNITHKRIDFVEEDKVTKDYLEAHLRQAADHRETMVKAVAASKEVQAKLFDKIHELSDKTEARFTSNEKDANVRHVELLNAIHGMRGK